MTTVPPAPQSSSADAVFDWLVELRCLRAPGITFTSTSRRSVSPEFLEERILATMKAYFKETGNRLNLLGVTAPMAGWPPWLLHCHVLLQDCKVDDPENPIADIPALKRIGRKHGLDVTVSDPGDPADVRRIAANHMDRKGARVVAAMGVRRKFRPRLSKEEKEKKSAAKKAPARKGEAEGKAAEKTAADAEWLAQNDRPRRKARAGRPSAYGPRQAAAVPLPRQAAGGPESPGTSWRLRQQQKARRKRELRTRG
jgi:hypothetical protein